MFCKECGTENLETQIECIQCKTILNTNLPLTNLEKIILISFSMALLASMFFGIVPFIIIIITIYNINKYKNTKFIEKVKKFLIGYVIILAGIVSVFCFYKSRELSELAVKHLAWYYDKSSFYFNNAYTYQTMINCEFESEVLIYVGIFGAPIGAYVIYFITNNVLNIFKKHEKWIINYGLFENYKNEKSILDKIDEKMQDVSKNSVYDADELLKWAELKEKGLITEEEFIKVKNKILEETL